MGRAKPCSIHLLSRLLVSPCSLNGTGGEGENTSPFFPCRARSTTAGMARSARATAVCAGCLFGWRSSLRCVSAMRAVVVLRFLITIREMGTSGKKVVFVPFSLLSPTER